MKHFVKFWKELSPLLYMGTAILSTGCAIIYGTTLRPELFWIFSGIAVVFGIATLVAAEE